MTAEPLEVRISALVITSDLQPRKGTRSEVVSRYATAMKAGAVFPPVEVAEVDGALFLVDGFHRVAALKLLGQTEVLALVTPAASLKEARWRAGRANLSHGLPLRKAELRGVFRAYVEASQHRRGGAKRGALKSYRAMAKELGIPHTTLRRWTQQDFPAVFGALGSGAEVIEGAGGSRDAIGAGAGPMKAAREALEGVMAVLPAITLPEDRWRLLGQLEALVASLREAGVAEPETGSF